MAPASAIWRRVSFVGIPEDIGPASPRSSAAEEPGSASTPMQYSARDQPCAGRTRRPPPDRRGDRGSPQGAPAVVGDEVLGRVDAARQVVVAALRGRSSVVYGVTTGFGSLADVRLTPEHSTALQHGLLRSHAVAVGNELSAEEVRAMLALRAHVLALGHSGVRREVVLRFVEMLDARHPARRARAGLARRLGRPRPPRPSRPCPSSGKVRSGWAASGSGDRGPSPLRPRAAGARRRRRASPSSTAPRA